MLCTKQNGWMNFQSWCRLKLNKVRMRRKEKFKCPLTLTGRRIRQMNMCDALAARNDNHFQL